MAPEQLPEAQQEDIALHALGLLTPEEAQGVTERMASDATADIAALRSTEQTVGLLGYVAAAIRPPAELRAKLMARLGAATVPTTPTALQRIAVDFATLAWQTTPDYPGVGFHWLRQDTVSGTATALVKIQPGSTYAAHLHRGGEDCLVIQGGFRDRRGEYHAGDFVYYEPGSVHYDFQALEGEECILFVVAHGGLEVLPAEA
jgi:anti-sigma factor ChrR (cupin superfamily)